jgi:predicted flap endonuclease-1-like 5' DNA nuclease
MRVVLTDGSEITCENFKAIESGVLLTKDKKRKKVFGFVALDEVRYVLPEDVEVERGDRGVETHGESALRSRPADGGTDVVLDSTDGADDDLRRLGGLGSTYADRLRSAGYETLSDLAAADPVALAEVASVPPGRGRRWVDAAVRAMSSESTADEQERAADTSDARDDDAEDAEDDE